MSSFATVFNAAAGRRRMLEQPQRLTRQKFVELQDSKITKLQNTMNKKVKWFLDHGDWQAALRIIMLNNKATQIKNIEKHSSVSVVTPETFEQLLHFDSPSSSSSSPSSSSKTALAYFIRDQALSDEIPNSPRLYENLVDNFCQTHQKPETALEVALEGNARWRFSPQEKQKMGMSILNQCAKQKNCWSIACQTMQVLLNDKNNNGNNKQSSSIISSSSEIKNIHELLGKAAYNSGLWRTVVEKESQNDHNINEEEEQNGTKKSNEDKTSIMWRAIHDASRAGETEQAIQLFNKIVATQQNSKENHLKHIRALHELLNALGFERRNWKIVVDLANKWIFDLNKSSSSANFTNEDVAGSRRVVIDDTLSNLVFSSFPSPFNNNVNDDTSKEIEAFSASSELFNLWMAEVDDFVPPPLTCALMVGFWNKIFLHRKKESGNTDNVDVDVADDEWIQNSMSLLTKFTIDQLDEKNSPQQFYKVLASIDDATYNALEKARAILLPLVEKINNNHDEKNNFLQFPSPAHIKMLDHRKLFDHRRKQWKQRYDQSSSSATKSSGMRSWLSRPARQDYFPAFGKSSMLGLQDVVDDQGDLEAAMRFAQHVGQTAYDGVDVNDTNLHNTHVRGAGLFKPVDLQNNNVSNASAENLFQDHRPGPFGKNERFNGWQYYGMGGQVIYPGHRSKVASPYHNMMPRRMKNLFSPTRNWRNSSMRSQLKTVSKNYKWGSAV